MDPFSILVRLLDLRAALGPTTNRSHYKMTGWGRVPILIRSDLSSGRSGVVRGIVSGADSAAGARVADIARGAPTLILAPTGRAARC